MRLIGGVFSVTRPWPGEGLSVMNVVVPIFAFLSGALGEQCRGVRGALRDRVGHREDLVRLFVEEQVARRAEVLVDAVLGRGRTAHRGLLCMVKRSFSEKREDSRALSTRSMLAAPPPRCHSD